MRSTQIETFVWLARLGSFKAVADRLSLTQPAITQRIAALESTLGTPLFHRGSHSVTLTAKGAEILPYAEQHLETLTQILLRCEDPSAHFAPLRLGVVETIAHVWLDALLRELHSRFPGITLELVVDSTVVLHDFLVSAELDTAFLLGPIADPQLSHHWLCSYPLLWVAGPDWPLAAPEVSVETLAQWPIMTYSRRSLPYHLISGLVRPQARGRLRVSASTSLDTTLRVVRQGLAVRALPSPVAQPLIDDGQLKPFQVESPLPLLEYVAAHPTVPSHPLTAHVIDIAREVAAG